MHGKEWVFFPAGQHWKAYYWWALSVPYSPMNTKSLCYYAQFLRECVLNAHFCQLLRSHERYIFTDSTVIPLENGCWTTDLTYDYHEWPIDAEKRFANKFRDCPNWNPLALIKWPDAFGLVGFSKEQCPHRLSKAGNCNHIVTLPEKSEFKYDLMKGKDKATFERWYEDEKAAKNNVYNFRDSSGLTTVQNAAKGRNEPKMCQKTKSEASVKKARSKPQP